MQWLNTPSKFGIVTQLFHWTIAAGFLAAYIVIYYVIWFMDDRSDAALPVLNVHWMLGLLVGFLVLPRILWRLLNVQPEEPSMSQAERLIARIAHVSLYGLMILMPITGYAGTHAPTDFGLFVVPSFADTALFAWISNSFDLTWDGFEPRVDAVHHFCGKWIGPCVIGLHIIAALFHHIVRRDDVLVRMLP